jgi:hypothetical protein
MMTKKRSISTNDSARYQRGKLSIDLGRRVRLRAEVELTSGGLLAIAALVSSILLSTAVLVHTAIDDSRRK